jgi:cytochrome c oxidase subunit II
MNVHLYERLWMYAAAIIIAVFLTVIGVSTYAYNVHPPSHVETIQPSKIFEDPRFARVGEVIAGPDGTLEVPMVASMFAFIPNEVRVPAGRPVRFRLTSADVVHGFMVSGTNANAMLMPGYVSQFTTVFSTPGDYLIVCHEFCGTGHHAMFGRIIVEGTR